MDAGFFAVWIPTAPPTATSPGQKGQMAMDGQYLYVCIATNTWRRVTLDGF